MSTETWNEPTAVQEVRRWRQAMQESWEGKTPEQIRAELNGLAERFEAKRKASQEE